MKKYLIDTLILGFLSLLIKFHHHLSLHALYLSIRFHAAVDVSVCKTHVFTLFTHVLFQVLLTLIRYGSNRFQEFSDLFFRVLVLVLGIFLGLLICLFFTWPFLLASRVFKKSSFQLRDLIFANSTSTMSPDFEFLSG